ncbi:MAG: histidyl-tRNA synthetase [Candidatus Atribacteria bacterium]|jgi:histidyl-tRNA synthetase|uniref:Histidine--tRNA ligase n=1 Tax=Thermatribacter velox TaxID=3039681 RepID=A0ABZ2YC75_9BACT|nr:histidyl-tRNA synthetase [Candidatus Atribacteria bacterium]MDI3530496.1 histidyl-tRNA synthetase [Candidatus Atribacteria bacterium]
MQKVRAPKGTKDILGEEIRIWHFLEETVRETARCFSYQEIRTPVFEHTELFQRSVGEATDIVQKEMYTFLDKSGRSLTLRPEGTAAVVRAYVEHGFHVKKPRVKWYYLGPMFRYERPQAGRMRQFHQFGFEAIGFAGPGADLEIILIAWFICQRLGLPQLSLEINSLGCPECKGKYLDELIKFLQEHSQELCVTCRERAQRNPLRVLDCKNEGCQRVFSNPDFPVIQNFLCEKCAEHQRRVEEGLRKLQVPFQVNPRLVRGLDYYTRTAFEVKSGELGAQNAVMGGGRYDGLADFLGVKGVAGVGFAAGMERLVLLLSDKKSVFEEKGPLVYLAPLSPSAESQCLRLALKLADLHVPFYLGEAERSLRAQLKEAQNAGIRFVVLLGEDEEQRGIFSLKDLDRGIQEGYSEEELLSFLERERRKCCVHTPVES